MRILPRSRRGTWLLAGAVVLAAGLACSWWMHDSAPGLNEPTELIIYSVDGRDRDPAQPRPAGETFHGYPVLGKVAVNDPEGIQEIAAALRTGIAQSGIRPAACFWPRHGVRATKGGKTVDYVICFECHQLSIHDDGSYQRRTTARTPQALLNRRLTAAGVPLAPGMMPDDS